MGKDEVKTMLIDASLAEAGDPDELPETPSRAIALPDRQRVAFISKTSPSYFTLRVSDGTVSPRIKLPAEQLTSLFFSARLRRVVIGATASEKKMIIPYDADADRPLLQQIFETGAVADLVREDASGNLFTLSKKLGVIDPLLQ